MSKNASFDDLHAAGIAAARAGDRERAVQLITQALAIEPAHRDAHFHRAVLLHQIGRLEAALDAYGSVLALDPRHADAHYNRGLILAAARRPDAALQSYEAAIASRGDYAQAWFSRGLALAELRRHDEALASYARAIALDPRYAEAFNNRANVLKDLGRHQEALGDYERAIALRPDYAEAWYSRGVALAELRRPEEALEAYDRAIALRPQDVDAHWNKSLVLLLLGRLEEGFALYEWRWKRPGKKTRDYAAPLWLGREPLDGKTILVHCEQGFGDTLQFCRYVPRLAARGANVVLQAPPELVALLRSLEGVSQLVVEGEPLPPFDFHCPLLSLPHAFATTLQTIPAEPYLRADAQRLATWTARLGTKTKPRIGIAWSGRAQQTNDRNRSSTLTDFLALRHERWELVSLQKQLREGDAALLEARPEIRHFGDELRDFADTAALCELVDVIVTVDTSVAHLAGALGRRAHVVLTWLPDWRWLLGRDDCPWYPSMRLHRQEQPADWAGVLEDVRRSVDPG